MSGDRVVKNTAALMGGEAGRRIIALVTGILIARGLTVEDQGRLRLGLALVAIFGVLANFGMIPLLTRRVAADPERGNQSFGVVLGLKTVLGFGAVAIVLLAAWFLNYRDATLTITAILAAIVWLDALEATATSFFDGCQRMLIPAAAGLLRALALLLLVLLALNADWGTYGVAGAYLAAAAFAVALSLGLVRRYYPAVRLRPRLAGGKKILREALPFVLIGFVWILLFRIDMVMLGQLQGERSVGYYSVGYAFFEVLLVLPMLSTRALYPALAEGMRESTERWRALLSAALRIFWLIALPVGIGSYFVGARFVVLLYSEKYAAAGPVITLLGPFLWLWFGTATFGWALTAADRTWQVLAANAIALALNIAANLLLIPRYDFLGATAATIISEFCLLAMLLFVLIRSYGGLTRHVFPWRAIPAAAALALTAWWLREANLALVIGAGAVIYLLLIVVCGALTDTERALLGRFLRRGNA